MKNQLQLNKSNYLKGIQCPKILWMDKYMSEKANKADNSSAEDYSKVRELSRNYFENCVFVDKSPLYKFAKFYQQYPKIVDSVSPQSKLLSWTHYRVLLQVEDEDARKWYENEAFDQAWSVRTLQRNISTQYYYRMLKTQNPIAVEQEMKELTSQYQNKLEFIKNPVIAEFLGMQEDTSYLESDLEQCIIDNLQKFLMELGKGYAFVARQQHIHTEKEDYYIDLVLFYVLIQMKILQDIRFFMIMNSFLHQNTSYIFHQKKN